MLGEEPGRDFTLAMDYMPESHIVVEEDGRLSGGMVLIIELPEMVFLFNPRTENDIILDPLVCKGIDAAKSLNANTIVSLLHGSNIQFSAIEEVLLRHGFILSLKKELYELKPAKYSPAGVDSSVVYKSIGQITEEMFVKIFKAVYEPDIFESDAEKCYADLKKNATNTGHFYPEDWQLAYVGDKPVGLTMPQLHDADVEIGSNFYLGLVPEERRKGLGTLLQRRAVETLIRRGVGLIGGSTDAKNTPMIKILEHLGYQFAEHQFFFILEEQ
ncbi:MAG: GNAT family N-acetyltransferase [candidate division WOR-3 bacterium]|nr:MAG: GNAT family N-acetyltransferase [candidate division WOR-3 bacterium]